MVGGDNYAHKVLSDRFMVALGYVRGSDLSSGHHFYRRDIEGVRTHKFHVCASGHVQIDRTLRFRALLRSDPVIRRRYQESTLRLDASNTGGIGEYLAKMAPFIESVIAHEKRMLEEEYGL